MRIFNFLFSIGILCSVLSISSYNLGFFAHSDNCSHEHGLDEGNPNNHFCGFDHLQPQVSEKERQLQESLEQELYQLIQKGCPATNSKALHTVPVVVHVVHNNGVGNIPNTQVTDAIQHLNDAFANVGAFNPLTGVDVEIQFCLAQRDPAGNATNGITNTNSPLGNMAMSQDAQLKSLIRWDPLNYINIYVVADISGGVAGYAYLPSAHGNAVDGIVLEDDYMGTSTDNSKVLVHEMGHYLGLYHTFQSGCTNNDCLVDGDKVCDTPPDGTTAWIPCASTSNSCTTDANDLSTNNPFRPISNGGLGDQVDQKENYMDYSRFECYDRFTPGQKTRCHFFLTGIRSSLLLSNGCLSPCPNPISASFTASATNITVGTPVNFTNTSTAASTYEWFVNNTSFATTTNSAYTFNTVGTFTVLLEANNGDPNCVAYDSITITVTCPVSTTFSADNSNPALGSQVNYTSTTTNATSYDWTVNNTSVGSLANFSYAFSSPGTYTICLTASNGLCSTTHCETYLVFLDTIDCGNEFLIRIGEQGIDEVGTSITPALNGTIYLAGNKGDSSFIINVDPNGNLLWKYNFNLHPQEERTVALIEDSDGNLVGVANGGLSIPTYEAFVYKFDPITKTFIWIQNFDACRNMAILERVPGGNYLTTTHDDSPPAPGAGSDVGIIELDRNTGIPTNSIDKSYQHGTSEAIFKLEQINNEIYACGRFTQGVTNAGYRGSISKLDATGNPIWTKMNIYPFSQNARMYSFDMVIDNDSIVMSYFGDNTNSLLYNTNKFYLSKSDINGNISWAKEYAVAGFSTITIYDIEKMGDGYLVYGLERQAPMKTFLARVDGQGNLLWQKSYSTHNTGIHHATQTLFVSGSTIYFVGTAFNGVDDDVLFAKLNSNGDIEGGCPEITPLNITVSNIVNPVENNVNLVVYPNPFTPTSLSSTTIQNYPDQQRLCETPCDEICDNGIDDDGDGLIDCDDPDCNCYFCEGKSSNHWYFGNQAAIEFSTGTPTSLTNSTMFASEGNATISDQAGNLLFYTNGGTVWDASHNTMLNGTGLGGSNISAQSAIIVKMPQNNSLYAIFTIPNWTDPAPNLNLSISYVDMTGNGGLGEVISKNTIIHTGVAEQVSACYHSNCQDIWIVTHERLNDNYISYLFTPTGVVGTPVISSVGATTTGGNRYGGLRFSHDGKKLCSTLGGSSGVTVELLDFDQSTGIVSNALTLADNASYSGAYSSEFSVNNDVLYVCEFNGSTIRQYDLTLPAANIASSMTNIATGASIKSALQMGPDNKIYVSKSGQSFLAAINAPNNLGVACGFVDNAVDLQGRIGRLGLPNFLPAIFEEALEITGPDSICANTSSIQFEANKKGCHTFGYQWWVSGNATIQSSIDSLVVLDFGATGQAVLYVERYDLCDTLLDSLVITIDCNFPACTGATPPLDLGPDTSFCENGIVILNASNAFDSYLWNTLSTDSTITATDPGLYWVEVRSACGTVLRDSIYISIDSIIPHVLSDSLICLYDTIQYNLNASYTYQWLPNQSVSCNNCPNPTFYPNTTTQYTLVSSTNSGCVSVDSFTIVVDTCFLLTNLSASACLGNYYSYNGTLLAPNSLDTFIYTSTNGYDSLVILQVNALDTFNVALDTTIQINSSYNGQFYSNDTTLIYNQQTTQGCDSILVVNIHIISNSSGQFFGIPDAFSPNGDNVNEDFKPIGLDESAILEFKVFNRWSQLIYDDTKINNGGWDGTFNGVEQPTEVYIYLLRYKIGGQSEVVLKGQVTLLR